MELTGLSRDELLAEDARVAEALTALSGEREAVAAALNAELLARLPAIDHERIAEHHAADLADDVRLVAEAVAAEAEANG